MIVMLNKASLKIRTYKLGFHIYTHQFQRWMSSDPKPGGRFAALWGNGDFGRLGLGCLNSQWTPKLLLSSAFKNENLKSLACGGAHTLFLTESGRVFATGLNDFGQLGITCNGTHALDPVEVSGLNKEIVHISAGYHNSSAITADGELYMWGRNSNGQLGLGKKAKKVVPIPTKVDCLSGISIKMVALGAEHSVAVTGDDEALSWGAGGSGRLGHENQSSIFGFLTSTSEYTPRRIKKLEDVKVKAVAAGMLHSACLDANGSIFIFGEQAVDSLGFGKAKYSEPYLVRELPNCGEVACGGYHTCAVTSHGEVYAWGINQNGCLGIGSTNNVHLPERIEDPALRSPVEKVSCGWKHTAAISGGNIYTWGWGGSNGTFSDDGHSSGGQLGNGSDVDIGKPMLVRFEERVKAFQVSCGFNHTAALVEVVDSLT